MAAEPPFEKTFHSILRHSGSRSNDQTTISIVDSECMNLPLIDLSRLSSDELERERCLKDLVEAASEWGFFQIMNHGVPEEILEMMYHEGKQLFSLPFSEKAQENFLNLPANCYRWGNTRATFPAQFSWSEAFHVSLTDISCVSGRYSLRSTIEVYVQEMGRVALLLCQLMGKHLNVKPNYFTENCLPGNSSLRMNKYSPCAISSQVFGLVPHTDSDFLTILFQDQVGGLQLKKDGRWISVKPRRKALVVNIGDLFQALSNGVYKSIEHRVVPPQDVERLSIAFFFCPCHETEIECFGKPEMYRKFSFGEYKEQIRRDVIATGDKVGLSRFLIRRNNL